MQKKTLFHHKITLKWYKILVFTFNQIVCVAVYNEGRVSQHFATRVLYLRLFATKMQFCRFVMLTFQLLGPNPNQLRLKSHFLRLAGWLASKFGSYKNQSRR